MNTRILLASLAPIALGLAACGGNDTAEPTVDDTAATTPADTAVAYPEAPLDARGSVDYAGTYTQKAADGTTRSIVLGPDDGYTITNADGSTSTGTFNWYSDNSRILIKEGGTNEVYAVADGYLYRLADENAPLNGAVTAGNAYTKVNTPTM